MASTSACAMRCHGAGASDWPLPRAAQAAVAPERQLVGRDRRQLRRRRAQSAQRPDRRDAHSKPMRLQGKETQ